MMVGELVAKLTADTQSFDTGIKQSQRELNDFQNKARDTSSATSSFDTSIKQSAVALDDFQVRAKETTAALGGEGSSGGGMFAAFMQLGTVGKLLGGSAILGAIAGGNILAAGQQRMQTIEDSTTSLTIKLGSAAKAGAVVADTLAAVQGTPFTLDQFIEASRTMITFGVETQKIPAYLKAIGEAAAGSGRGIEAVATITDVFSKISVKGDVALDDIWRLADQGVDGLTILGNAFGKTTADMQAMISYGTVPAEKALDALVSGISQGSSGVAGQVAGLGGSMEALRKTMTGATGGMEAAAARLGVAILQPFQASTIVLINGVSAAMDKLAPIIGSVFKSIGESGAFKWFMNSLVTVANSIIDIGAGAIKLATTFGPLKFILEQIVVVAGVFAAFFVGQKLYAGVLKLRAAFKALSAAITAAMAVNPILLAIAAIVVAMTVLYKSSESFRKKIQGVTDGIAKLFLHLRIAWELFRNAFIQYAKEIEGLGFWNKIINAGYRVRRIWDFMKLGWLLFSRAFKRESEYIEYSGMWRVLVTVASVLRTAWDGLAKATSIIFGAIGKAFSILWAVAKVAFEGIYNVFKATLGVVFDLLKAAADIIFPAVTSAWKSFSDGWSGESKKIKKTGILGFFQNLGDKARSAFDAVKQKAKSFGDQLAKTFDTKNIADKAKKGWEALVAGFTEGNSGIASSGIGETIGKVGIAARIAFEDVKKKSRQAFDTLKEKAGEAFDKAKELWHKLEDTGVFDDIKKKARGAFDNLREKTGEAFDKVVELWGKLKESGLWGDIKKKAGEAFDGLKTKASGAMDTLKEKFGEAKKKFDEMLEDRGGWEGIKTRGKQALGTIGEQALIVKDNIATWFESIGGFDMLREKAAGVFTFIGEQITNVKNLAVGIFDGLGGIDGIKDKAMTAFDAIKAAAQTCKDVVDTVFSGLKTVIDDLQGPLQLMKDNLVTTATVIGGIALGFAAWFGIPALIALIVPLVEGLFLGFVGIVAVLGGPLTIAIGAIALLGTAIYVAYKNSEAVRDVVDGIWQSIQDGVDSARKSWDDMYESIKPLRDLLVQFKDETLVQVKDAWGEFTSFFSERSESIREAASNVWAVISGIFKVFMFVTLAPFIALVKLLQWVWTTAGGEITAIVGNIANTLSTLFTSVIGIIGGVIDVVLGLLTLDWDRVLDGLKRIGGSILTFGITFIENVVKIGANLILGIGKLILSLGKGIAKMLGKAIVWVVKGAWNLVKALGNAIITYGPMVLQWFMDLPLTISKLLLNAADWLIDTGISILAGLVNGISTGLLAVAWFLTSLPGWILGFLNDATTWLLEKGKDIINGLWQGIQEKWDGLLIWFADLPKNIKEKVPALWETIKEKGSDLINGLWQGIQEKWDSGLEFFKGLPGKIKDFAIDAGKWLLDAGGNVIKGMFNGMKAVDGWFKEKFDKFIKALVPDFLEELLGIDSPSKVAAEKGKYFMLGLAKGMMDNGKPVMDATKWAAEAMIPDLKTVSIAPFQLEPASIGDVRGRQTRSMMSSLASQGSDQSGIGGSSGSSGPTVTNNFTINESADPRMTANEVIKKHRASVFLAGSL